MKVTKHDTMARLNGKAVVIMGSYLEVAQVRYSGCLYNQFFFVNFSALTAF